MRANSLFIRVIRAVTPPTTVRCLGMVRRNGARRFVGSHRVVRLLPLSLLQLPRRDALGAGYSWRLVAPRVRRELIGRTGGCGLRAVVQLLQDLPASGSDFGQDELRRVLLHYYTALGGVDSITGRGGRGRMERGGDV